MDTLRRMWRDCYDRINQSTNKREQTNVAPHFNNPSINISRVHDSNEARGKSDTENMQEFEASYTALIADLGLDEKAKETLLNFSDEKKIKLYRQISQTKDRVSYYVELLENYARKDCQVHIDTQTDSLERLKALLRSSRVSFVKSFFAEGGLEALLTTIETTSTAYPKHRINEVTLACLKNCMNCQEGRRMVLKSDKAVDVVAKMSVSCFNHNDKARVTALGILSGLCMVPGGHIKVLRSFNYLHTVTSERCRFQMLVRDLDMTSSTHLTIAIIVLINSLINYGAGLKLLEFRLHLRYEFLMLGFLAIIEKLKKTDNSLYEKHIEFFEMVRRRDEKEFCDKISTNKKRVDSKSVTAMADHLKQKHLLSPTYPHLLSILYHLVLIPQNSAWTLQQWKLIDVAVQDIAVPQSDNNPKEGFNVKNAFSKLLQEDNTKEIRNKLDERDKEIGEIRKMLDKKEKEVTSRIEEKNVLLETLSDLKRKLETEALSHKQQIKILNEQIKDLRKNGHLLSKKEKISTLENDEDTPKNSISTPPTSPNTNDTNSIISETGVQSCVKPSQSDISAESTTGAASGDLNSKISEIPIPPPPVPPPIFNMPPTKNIPQPKQMTKCFNWVKIQHHRINNSIWGELSDETIYPLIDLEDLEKKFSAYQRSQQIPQGSKGVAKELSLVDGRKSQNCNIMLAKLKMSNEQLIEALTTGDPSDSLSRDVCEQLQKFLPTSEEASLLKEHEAESSQMARPDLFLFRMSQVEHYEQMLNGVTFKKKFNERITDLSKGIKAVLEASNVCVKSPSFRKLLEIVLALGNFMNRGNRGNASGFKLDSLSKLQDTKAVDQKSSLVHYLVQLCSDKFPETLTLEEDLASTRDASKVNLQEVDTEMKTLGNGLKQLDIEATYEEQKNEKFSSEMKEFLQIGVYRYENLVELSTRMKKQYTEMLVSFCEEDSTQPDECFKHISSLLDTMADARRENLAFKKQQEEEEAKALKEAQMRSDREKRRYLSTSTISPEEDMGEFDEMIRTLMTGDAYGGTMARGKRNNVRKLSIAPESITEEEPSIQNRRTKHSRSLANILESRER